MPSMSWEMMVEAATDVKEDIKAVDGIMQEWIAWAGVWRAHNKP